MNFDNLNKMLLFIENNLDNEIDYKKLSEITNTNIFILERIFNFLTNMTITEYIKKRRLSKAFEDLKNTNLKIIDIAFKYGFNSPQSFNRAFKKTFNITPSTCRKSAEDYKIIPMEYFEYNKIDYNFDYKIKEIKPITLYGYHITSKKHNDLLYKIRQLYKMVKNNYHETKMYGIFYKSNDLFHYYLGFPKYIPNLEKYEIKKNKYAIFKLLSRNQDDIVNLEKKIIKKWLPSTNYHITDNIKIEVYQDNFCDIYLPIEQF